MFCTIQTVTLYLSFFVFWEVKIILTFEKPKLDKKKKQNSGFFEVWGLWSAVTLNATYVLTPLLYIYASGSLLEEDSCVQKNEQTINEVILAATSRKNMALQGILAADVNLKVELYQPLLFTTSPLVSASFMWYFITYTWIEK